MTVEPQTRLPPPDPVPAPDGPEAAPGGAADSARWVAFCQRCAAGCALVAMAIALLALLGWATGVLALAGGVGKHVPMAPASGVAFLLLGSALYFSVRAPGRARAYAGAVGAFLALWGLLGLAKRVAGFSVGLEEFFIGNRGYLGDVPVGYMTPISGFNFLFAGTALLLLASGWSRRLRGLAATLPLLVVAINMWVLWAYFAFPGEQARPEQTLKSVSSVFQLAKIPVAFPTAVCFLALGLGLVLAEGPQHFLMRHLAGPSTRAWLLRAFLPKALVLVLLCNVLAGLMTYTLPFDLSVSLLTLWTLVAPILAGLLLARIAIHLGAALDRAEAERLRALQLRHARDAAEEANRAKDRFLASMSHELRTPLNAILGYSEMLQEDAADAAHVGLLPDLEKIHASGKHLLALINDILDLAKLAAGKFELCPETSEVEALAREAADTVRPVVEKNGNALEVWCRPGLGQMRADTVRLRQVLFNLLSNAGKFTEKGTVTLEVERVAAAGGDRVRFRVRDTGRGIPPEKLEVIFQPFVQADASIKRKEGTGLGLAVSRKLSQAMGGDLTVESEEGKGSVFTLDLPAEAPERQAERARLDGLREPMAAVSG